MTHTLRALLVAAGFSVASPAPATAQTAAPADTAAPPIVRRVAATHPDTLELVVPIPGIEVSTTGADHGPPVPHAVLGRAELQRRNIGRDTPMELATLPGVYAYSDAGNGVGYSYLSIRGFPQRRISVLVNGVPLNDPESHEVYWIDHPDLLASAREVQVQRGVGSALYGAASLGGSVIVETSPFTSVPAYSVTWGCGSRSPLRQARAENGSRRSPHKWWQRK